VSIKRGIVLGWPFYYGWVIVGLALLSLGVWAGLRTAFAVFYVALLDEFSWSRGATAGVQSMAYVTYILLAPLVGGMIDRFGPRRVILPGILMLSAGHALASLLKSLTQFYLIDGLLEMVIGAGCALGAWIAGFIFDRTQSYQWAFLLAVSGSVLSGFFVWFAAPRKGRRKRRIKEIR
jgi:MFS family permease